MNSALIMPVERPRLRVAIFSADRSRRSTLSDFVQAAGHSVCATAEEADVVVVVGSIQHPDHPAVARLSAFDDDEVAGVLPEHATAGQILAAVEALGAGLSVRMRSTANEGFGVLFEPKLQSPLTPREAEVLGALAEGLSNKAIARKLEISQHTVKFHIESVFRKLGVRTRAQAVLKGLASMSGTRFEI